MSDARARGSAPFRALDEALLALHRVVRLLPGVTPSNLVPERARLETAYAGGQAARPRWEYPPVDLAAVASALTRVLRELTSAEAGRRAADDALEALAGEARERVERLVGHRGAAARDGLLAGYRARVQELQEEAELLACRGRGAFGERAAARRARARRRGGHEAADAHVAAWLEAAADGSESASGVATDSAEETSLLSRVRSLLGALALPVKVAVRRDLSALAATGDDTVYVAAGRSTTADAAFRIAVHEVLGHALPRGRARELPLALFAVGTAGGVDEQEGYALALEARYGLLDASRRRELAVRHGACALMDAGADFEEAMAALAHRGVPLAMALAAAERAYRGGDGRSGGLGREAAYVPAWVRVEAALARDAAWEPLLAAGQVALPSAAGAGLDP